MDNKVIYWVFVVVFVLAIVIGTQIYKRYLIKKYLRCLQQRDFDGFFKVTDSIASKYFFPYFNRLYMKMNAYMLMPDKKKVEETFEELLAMRTNKKQNLDISVKAFYYYVDESSKQKCKELLERIKGLEDPSSITECQMIYDIFVCKKGNYIETMKEQLAEQSEDLDKGMLHYMLGVQYENLGDTKQKKECLEAALVEMKDTPYEARIKQMLEAA